MGEVRKILLKAKEGQFAVFAGGKMSTKKRKNALIKKA